MNVQPEPPAATTIDGSSMSAANLDNAACQEERRLRALAIDPQRGHSEGPMLQELEQVRRELAAARHELERLRTALVQERRSAGSDSLTGLPNRRGFDRPSRRVLATHGNGSQPLALLFIDLDGFKAVNDRLGHDAGDELLRIVGTRLVNAVREGDLVCRHGGDEFLCLLSSLGEPGHAANIAAELLQAIGAPCQLGAHSVTVTASIGVALYPRDGRTMDALIRAADASMYAAKAQGIGLAIAGNPCASARSDPRSGSTLCAVALLAPDAACHESRNGPCREPIDPAPGHQ